MNFFNNNHSMNTSEQIPMRELNRNESDDSLPSITSNVAVRRSATNAGSSDYRPQVRVRFNSLAADRTKRSLDGGDLISSTAHQMGFSSNSVKSGGWQNTILSRRRLGLSPQSQAEEMQEIARAMVEDEQLMANDVDGERLRRDAVRKLTKPLSTRKEILRCLTLRRNSNINSYKRLSLFKSVKYNCGIQWYKVKSFVGEALRDFSLWEKDLKSIEGIFGSSVGSYFRFLRYLFLVNSFVALVIFFFVFLPQLLLDSNNTSVASDNSSQVFGRKNVTFSAFNLLDIFTGSGWFGESKLFYGAYQSGVLTLANSSISINAPQSYFFVIYSCLVLYTALLLYKIVVLYRANFIDAEDDPTLTFVNKILLAWDFNVTDREAGAVKSRSIYNELVELVEEFVNRENVESVFSYLKRKVIQTMSWFVFFCFLLLLSWGLYLLLKDSPLTLRQETFQGRLHLLAYPIIVTFIMAILPRVFENAGKLEIYRKPRYELYVSVTRVILLGIVVLLPLIIFWYENSPGLKEEIFSNVEHVVLSHSLWQQEKIEKNFNSTEIECWENGFGQEIYRLVIVDFIVILFSILCVDNLKVILAKRGNIRESTLRFSIPINTLHVVYNQTLLWVSLFFCPLLSMVVSVKFFVLFQLQKWTVLKNFQPLERPWRATQSETLFQTLNLLCLILAIFSNGFIVIRGYSSSSCGPFKDFEHYLDIVWNAFENSEKTALKIVAFFLKPGTMLFVLAVLSLLVYYLKADSEGRLMMVKMLRKQVHMEIKDRTFLLNLIEKVQKGEMVPSARGLDSSSISFAATSDNRVTQNDPKFDLNTTSRSSFIFSKTREDV